MRAVVMDAYGGPEVLRVVLRPTPVPGPGEVLVRVHAAGVNRVDVLQRTGAYRPPAGTTDILGVEFSGVVAALGEGAARYRIGDRVCGIGIGGGYAEYCVAPEPQVLPVPGDLDDIAAGAIAETAFTVWTALMDHGRFQSGETVLVHGGTSGIGTAALMLAREFGASHIFATAGSADKCAVCATLGATRAIDYRREDFGAVINAETGGRGVDVILDIVGGAYFTQNMAVLADDGRLVFIGRMSQDMDVTANMLRIMYARLVITGVSLRGQSVSRKGRIAGELEARVWPLVASGKMRPVIDSVYDLADAAEAHRRLEGGTHIGKIVLCCATP